MRLRRYKYDGRDIKRRFLEILPALLSAGIMTSLMWLGLAYHDHEVQAGPRRRVGDTKKARVGASWQPGAWRYRRTL